MGTMTQQYRLNCSQCEASQPVEPRLAGSTVSCKNCQATIDVPKLRELKQLEPIRVETETTPKRGWGRLSGGLFGAGLLTLAISVGSIYYLHNLRARYEIYTEKPNIENFTFADLSQASLTETWSLWEQLLERREVVNRETPGFVRMRQQIERWDFWSKFFYGLATVGLASILASPFFRPKLEI